MKKYYTILLCLFSVFFLFSGEVKADETITFSCDYSYGSGDSEIKVRVKVVNLDYKYIKDEQQINTIVDLKLGNYVQPFLWDGSDYVSRTSFSKKYPAYDYYDKQVGVLHSVVNLNANRRSFLKAATISRKGVACPTMYIDFDGVSENYIYIATENMTGSYSMNLDSQNCYNDEGKPQTCELNEEVTSEDLRNPDILECEYSGNASWTFKLLYDKNNKTFTFDNNGSALKLVEMNEETLLSKFSSNECPSRIDCKCDVLQQCYIYTNKTNTVCGVLKSTDGDKVDENSINGQTPSIPDLDIYDEDMSCAEILGPNGVKVVKLGINILRIAGAIIALVNAMLSLLPAVMSKDADGLKKAGTKCVYMAIILALIFLFPTLLKIIGKMFEWDISCLV